MDTYWVKLRRIARLEALADRRFQSEQLDRGERLKNARDGSFVIIANVCLIARYGAPRTDELLTEAWKRCLETLLRKFPGFAKNGRANPFNFAAAAVIALDFRKYVLPRLRGTDDNDKIYRVLADAPQWLLWHTYADKSCASCGIEVPDISNMLGFARGFWFLGILPPGPFELRARVDATRTRGPKREGPGPPRVKTRHELLGAARVLAIRNYLVDDFQAKLAEGYKNGSIRVRPFGMPPPIKAGTNATPPPSP